MTRMLRIAVMFACMVMIPGLVMAKPWGYLVSADGKTKIALEGDEVVVGTDAKSSARISGKTISSRHAKLVKDDKGVVHVSDLGSRYGTLVAGVQLKKGVKMRLLQTTKLTMGAETWTFVWGARGKMIAPVKSASKANKSKTRKKRVKSSTSKSATKRGK